MFANLVNERTQTYKGVKVGFSWTEMFFGFWTPVFRGDFKWASVLVLAEIIFGSFTWGGGAFLVTFIFAFSTIVFTLKIWSLKAINQLILLPLMC